ncbi:dimethylhistidine N-methyltransferase [Arenibacter nanhaiticus]|uniref:Dimethylhistidine N-methyltransferase n=1 Tax=Arenibacter nanhaiticus TaxID=558155 RepID=A0A1M6HGE6_9FLAO|nr:L-histidine N(alpha)-methyltransferase [Arenibacter nanhaiticus]SHJ21247.1 dimethylhistidine N-methyltransferase [Arenibacter nanhaiticus]
MENNPKPYLDTPFKQDVYKGLSDFPKHLSSKYLYDANGDKIFQAIMNLPEYYLTNSEFSILQENKEEICTLFAENTPAFNLIELGAGDAKKTKILLAHLNSINANFKYLPIDLSENALKQLESSLAEDFPNIHVAPKCGSYIDALETVAFSKNNKNIILFLGSNIGNMLISQAISFLKKIKRLMHKNDILFLGCDLKKDPQLILNAYSDTSGITASFNKNILKRINTELQGNFNVESFMHWEAYDPESGTAKSYLVSQKPQQVTIAAINLKVHFKAWETIHTEISQKYDHEMIQQLSEEAGLKIVSKFGDKQDYFQNYLLIKK